MAINKKLIHFNTFENFNSKKLSANAENTQYTLGTDGTVQTGSPDILYQSIVYIKDTKLQWTHGLLYAGNLNNYITKSEVAPVATSGSYSDLIDTPTIPDISVKQDTLVSGTNIKTINGESILGEGNIIIESGAEQADWNETETTSLAYIANKPNIPTKTSDLTNDSGFLIYADEILEGFIYTPNTNDYISFASLSDKRTYTPEIDAYFKGMMRTGNGTKFLSDNGTYKEISGGNVQAVDTSETLEDVETNTYISYLLQNLTEEQKELVKLNIGIKTAYELVNHGTSNTTYILTPNVFHVWDEVTNLDLTLGLEESGILNEFLFQFSSGATATTLALPATVKWVNDNPIEIESNKTYQISILKNMASGLFYSN